MKRFKAFVRTTLLVLALLGGALAAYAWYWSEQSVDMTAERMQYVVEPGTGVRGDAAALNRAGVDVHPDAVVILARLTGMDKQIKAAAYAAQRVDSPRRLLERVARGEMEQSRLTLVEGWTYQRIRHA